MPYRDIRRLASDKPTSLLRIVAPIVTVVICFCAICVYVLSEARRTSWERAGDASASLVAAIESEIVRNVESLNLSLEGVIDNLKRPDIRQISPELRQLVLFDHSATAQHFGAILVLDQSGHLRFDSRHINPSPLDLSERDYFKVHKHKDSSVLYVGQPQESRLNGAFFVGISRRLSNADGSFAGVVAGTIQLNHFMKLFSAMKLAPGSAITLARTDGTILMRWPFDASLIGRAIGGAEISGQLAQSRSGRFEAGATADGSRRLVAYSQVSDLPIVIEVGQATGQIYAQWWRYAFTIGLLIAALCVLSTLLVIYLLRDLKRRDTMERMLATLAITDGLTGVSNRWHFDETIRREWQRALRAQSSLALLFIDADHFKTYNDRHGHQAGDQLLKAIGAAISSGIRVGVDIGARYGGDEFAVLLPETTLAGAARVADRIRDHFVTAWHKHNGDNDATISVGVACLVPNQATAHTALLAAADTALYRAKELGRNRTELGEAPPAKSIDAICLVQDRAA